MERRESRRSVSLSEQLAMVESYNLGDLLKFRDEDEVCPSSAACEKREASSAAGGAGGGQTLLDMMREEHGPNGAVVGRNSGNGIKWKSFKNLLRLRCASAAWMAASSDLHSPVSYPEVVVSVRPNPVLARSASRSISIRSSELPVPAPPSGRGALVSEYNPAAAAATSPPEEHPSGGAGGEETTGGGESSDLGGSTEAPASVEEEEPPVRVSLMALLEETDRQWSSGGEGSSPATALVAAAEEEEEEEADDVGGGGIFNVCCVCMVRLKGAAFIPCGHTFCRLCSRELWVSRGTCPLCNADIAEVLDIF